MSAGKLGVQSSDTRRKAVVIGGGLGGLSAAVSLAHAGLEVLVLEKTERVGGKLGTFSADGFTWDTGPSLLTMPHILRELWASVGRELDDYLELIQLEVGCRYRWDDGTVLDADAEFRERKAVKKFLRYARGLYEISDEVFLHNPIEHWRRQIRPRNLLKLRHFPKIASPRSLHQRVRASFKDPKLVQLFDRYATFNGSSPYSTPAAFNVIPFAEMGFGSWYVRGGLFEIVRAFEKLATELGVRIVTRAEVTGLRRLPSGFSIESTAGYCAASTIICNEDALSAASKYLGLAREKETMRQLKRQDLSMSGFVMMLGLRGWTDGIAHHNIFFSNDYRAEFRQIFDKQTPSDNPTIYAAVDCVTDPSRAPADCENWFVLVNAPPDRKGIDWSEAATAYGDHVLERLRQFGLGDVRERIVSRHHFTPADFRQRFNAYAGSLYGFASHGMRTAFRRPSMRVKNMPGIYLAGGTTHPGGGIPLVVLSGQIAARELLRDLTG